MEEKLPKREQKKLDLYGNAFKTKRNKFLYATNWVEMDAELGSWCIFNKFKLPTLEELIEHYKMFYADDKISEIIGKYVYDYFFYEKKNLKLREGVFARDKESIALISS